MVGRQWSDTKLTDHAINDSKKENFIIQGEINPQSKIKNPKSNDLGLSVNAGYRAGYRRSSVIRIIIMILLVNINSFIAKKAMSVNHSASSSRSARS